MTKIIGLTGGIASGKSTVAQILWQQQLPVIDADQVARQVEMAGTPTFSKIIATFGEQLVLPSGELDRRALGKLVFQDPKLLKKLNQITQSPIQYAIFKALLLAGRESSIIVLDVPLLFEGGWQNICDITVVVSVDAEQQLQRLRQRNKLSLVAAQNRINAQLPISVKRELADQVIDNSGTIEETKAIVLQWLATLL